MNWIFTIAIIALTVAHINNKRRISDIEEKMTHRSFSGEPQPKNATPTTHIPRPIAPNHKNSASTASQTANENIQKSMYGRIPAPSPVLRVDDALPVTPSKEFFLYRWFKEQALIKIGAIIFFLGSAWFVSYAYEQNWVPPLVRIMFGLLIAIGFYVVGATRQRFSIAQSSVLTALGTAIVFVTVVAAQFSFHAPLLSNVSALTVLLLSVSYSVLVAKQHNTEWLAVASALAALFAPQITGADVDSVTPFFGYLLIVSIGLGSVVLLTTWRYVTLVLLIGVLVYTVVAASNSELVQTMWPFVISFVSLFTVLTTISVIRDRVPLTIDAITILLLGAWLAYFVSIAATLPAVVSFLAALVMGSIGYLLRLRDSDPKAVLLYASASIVGILVGTAYLFSGTTAVLVFTIEATALVLLAIRLAFLRKTIYLAVSTFSIPVFLAVESFYSSIWETGIMHATAFSSVALVLAVGGVGGYLYYLSISRVIDWVHQLAKIVILLWYVYTVLFLLVVATSVAAVTSGSFFVVALGLLLSFSIGLSVMVHLLQPSSRLEGVVSYSFGLPVLFALIVVSESVQADTFTLIEVGLLLLQVVSLAVLSIICFKLRDCAGGIGYLWYIWLWVGFVCSVYFLGLILSVWIPEPELVPLIAITMTGLSYLIINCLLHAAVRLSQIIPFILVLTVPSLFLVPAFDYALWRDQLGILSVQPVALYVHITLLFLLARTLFFGEYTEQQRALLRGYAIGVTAVAGVSSIALVWSVSHSVLQAGLAVFISLSISTVAGLVFYLVGTWRKRAMYVRAGYVLLTFVVIRLGLVDAWDMEPMWRIVTFLCIGAAFIAVALLERHIPSPDNR